LYRRAVLPLALFGALRSFKPSDPFLVRFLTTERGFSEDFVNNNLYAVWTYAYIVFLGVVGLCTDKVGYRNAILLEGLAQAASFFLLFFARALPLFYLSMVLEGLENGLSTAYYSYPYELVRDEGLQQKLGSYAYTAIMVGYFFGGVVGQFLLSETSVPVGSLFYFSIPSSILASVAAFFIPRERTVFFTVDGEVDTSPPVQEIIEQQASVFSFMFWKAEFSSVRGFFINSRALGWTLIYILSSTAIYNVETYCASVFFAIDNAQKHDFNGIVQSLASLVAALGSFLPSVSMAMIRKYSEVIAFVLSSICSLCILVMARWKVLIWSYFAYVIFEGSVYYLVAMSTARLVASIENRPGSEELMKKFALIMGFSGLVSTVIPTILQVSIQTVDPQMSIFGRFFCYAVMNTGLTVFTLGFALCSCTKPREASDISGHSKASRDDSPLLQASSNSNHLGSIDGDDFFSHSGSPSQLKKESIPSTPSA